MRSLLNSLIVGAASALILGGWVATDTPEYRGSANMEAADSASAPGRSAGRVGLVLTNNTNMSVADLQENIVRGGEVIIPNTKMIQDLDPVYMHARLLAALKSRYPNISLQNSISNSIKNKNALTVVADVRSSLGKLSGQTTSVSIILLFKDAKGRQISKISGQGSATLPYPAWDYRIQEAADAALSQISAKL